MRDPTPKSGLDCFPSPDATGVRHRIVILATLAAFLLYLDRYCFSFVERFVKRDLNLTDADMGVLLSAFFWSYALAQVPAGWLSDRYGARLVFALYILFWSLFTGLLGVAYSFTAVLLWRLGCGVAQAGAFPTSAALLSRWVPFARRGLASGLVSIGGRLGGALASVLTAYVMLGWVVLTQPPKPDPGFGWRPAMIFFGLIGLLVAEGFWWGVRDQPGEHPACNLEEVKLIEHGRPGSATRTQGKARGLPLAAMLQHRSLWLISLAQLGTGFGWALLLTWLPRYLAEVHDVPLVQRGWLAGIPVFVGMAGMFAGGWLTDHLTARFGLRWGRCLPLALSRFVAMFAYWVCLFLHSPWLMTVAFAVVAFATDLGSPAVWAYNQDTGGRHVGTILGWGNMWGNFGAALSPIVLNRIVESWGWEAAFLTCAGAFLFAGVVSLGVDATIPIVQESQEAFP
jgi:ACS family glucarate transporter-like MFS transporter